MYRSMYEPYDAIAFIYDDWQKSFSRPYSETVAKLLKKELQRNRIEPGKFLDLACGTGDAAIVMAERGWIVTGVDSSPAMLDKAREKVKERRLYVSFLQQRMEELDLGETFHMAGSFYDSINHITSKRTLQKAFKRLRKHLDNKSLFVFDSNTLSCYRNLWDTTSVGHEDGYTLIIENNFDESTTIALSNITIFHREKGTKYTKSVAQVSERWYRNEELEQILNRTGFEVVRRDPVYLFNYNEPEPYKQWWVCRAV